MKNLKRFIIIAIVLYGSLICNMFFSGHFDARYGIRYGFIYLVLADLVNVLYLIATSISGIALLKMKKEHKILELIVLDLPLAFLFVCYILTFFFGIGVPYVLQISHDALYTEILILCIEAYRFREMKKSR